MAVKRLDDVLIVVDDLEAVMRSSSNWDLRLRVTRLAMGLWSVAGHTLRIANKGR
ncbi:hypothetical protein [Lacunimicrobium album]